LPEAEHDAAEDHEPQAPAVVSTQTEDAQPVSAPDPERRPDPDSAQVP
jgi:hypothetical protein